MGGWFSSKKSLEAAMEVGAKFIGMVNKNAKLFCKDKIENITKYWPGDYYPALRSKTVVPRGWSLISIGYKYNMRNVLYFIVTENTGIKQIGLPYLSNYPKQFNNVVITPLDIPLVMYIYISAVNEFDYHNKSSQPDLALEKFWVTQCDWINLCTTVDNITIIIII